MDVFGGFGGISLWADKRMVGMERFFCSLIMKSINQGH